MFNNLLGIFNSLKETLIVIAVIAVIILLMVILLKFKNGKWVILGLMALVLVVGGVFTGYANYEYFTAKGGTFGSFGDIFKNKNKLMQNNLTFNFENFVLVATGNGNEYSARLSIDAVDQKMTNKAIFVNGNPTKLVARGDTYIFSDYNYTFKDENLTEICSDTLTIKFVFNLKSSECILSTIGGLDKVLYWNYFLKKNNFIVEIKDEEYQQDVSIIIEDVKTYNVNLYIDNKLYKTLTNSAVNRLELPEYLDCFKVLSYKDSSGKVYSSDTLPLEDIDLYVDCSFGRVMVNFENDNIERIPYAYRFTGKPIIYSNEIEKEKIKSGQLLCDFIIKDFGAQFSSYDEYKEFRDFEKTGFVEDGKYVVSFCYEQEPITGPVYYSCGFFKFYLECNDVSFTPIIELSYLQVKSEELTNCTFALSEKYKYLPIHLFSGYASDLCQSTKFGMFNATFKLY